MQSPSALLWISTMGHGALLPPTIPDAKSNGTTRGVSCQAEAQASRQRCFAKVRTGAPRVVAVTLNGDLRATDHEATLPRYALGGKLVVGLGRFAADQL